MLTEIRSVTPAIPARQMQRKGVGHAEALPIPIKMGFHII
jgi:hypothetical protein